MRARVLVVAFVVVAGAGPARAQDPTSAPFEDGSPAPEGAPPPSEAVPPPPESAPDDRGASPAVVTGAVRAGLYTDSDQTLVFRALAALGGIFGRFHIGGTASVDVVSSSSVDVRSSPQLSKVDVMTSASGNTTTSGGKMSDRRLQGTLDAGYRDNDGRALAFTGSYANENDYNSVSGGVNGSIDLFHRMTTLVGGARYTHNWIGSVLDRTFARTMWELAWSAGVAQVLSRSDAVRLRYDGAYANGYQASPYRYVRFGDWTTSVGANQQILFANTIGSPDGLPENEPNTRLRHALVADWLHSFTTGLALHLEARGATDSWGILSGTAGLELRASTDWWRLQIGYRFYAQSAADFFQDKYTQPSTSYAYFTSDKELGRELGHVPHVDIARVLKQADGPGASRMLLDLQVMGMFYSYPGFPLLGSRAGLFFDVGLTWEP